MEEEIDLDKEADREYKKIRQSEERGVFSHLSGAESEEYEEIQKKLKEAESGKAKLPLNKDKTLKKRIARFALDLVHSTEKDKEAIMETSYVLTSFIRFSFGDELEEIIDLASELELPEEHVSGDVFEMWKELEKKLREYLE